jgi:hypothetical protein
MTSPISHLFATHEQARRAAALLDQAGIPRDQVSLLDQHRNGQGGTLMTVQVQPEQAGLVASLLPGAPVAMEAAPDPDLSNLHDAAPAYVAGGTANLGTPGPD